MFQPPDITTPISQFFLDLLTVDDTAGEGDNRLALLSSGVSCHVVSPPTVGGEDFVAITFFNNPLGFSPFNNVVRMQSITVTILEDNR